MEHGVLERACREWVRAAFVALEAEHVVPPPIFHPHLQVGRDYFGDSVRTPEYDRLDEALTEAYPHRFAEPLRRPDPEFASSYMFSFLEACIARCSREESFDSNGTAVTESIEELYAVLEATDYEMVCCRHVSHLTTDGADELVINGITVVREPEQFGALTNRIAAEIPGADRAWNRNDPRPYDPPHALLIMRDRDSDPDPYRFRGRLSSELSRFLLSLQLLTAGTMRSSFEVAGVATLVSRGVNPVFAAAPGERTLGGMVRRTVRLHGGEGPAITEISNLLDAADLKREGMLATSFDVALGNFARSNALGNWYDQIVTLATALEGVLLGSANEGEVTFRLRSRSASLLATESDPAGAVFDDVGLLYSLRSKLVHGGQLKESDLRKTVGRLSTMPEGLATTAFGVAVGYAVDRMRDIVRRAILARLLLAAAPAPLWAFDAALPIDALMADRQHRDSWSTHWKSRLADIGFPGAAEPAGPAVDFLSREDR